MRSAAEIINELAGVEVPVRCRKCGATPALVGKQYSVRCPACGTEIRVTPDRLAWLKLHEHRQKYAGEEPRPACATCGDRGYVVAEEQIDDALCTFAYRCFCRAGADRTDLAGWPVIPLAKARREAAP